jgi:hypothetical protein
VTAKLCNPATKAVPPSSGCIAPSQRGGRGGFLTYPAGADHRRARQPATADPQQPVDPAWFNSRWPFRTASRSLGQTATPLRRSGRAAHDLGRSPARIHSPAFGTNHTAGSPPPAVDAMTRTPQNGRRASFSARRRRLRRQAMPQAAFRIVLGRSSDSRTTVAERDIAGSTPAGTRLGPPSAAGRIRRARRRAPSHRRASAPGA